MDRPILLKQITDFWREQGQFGEAREYVGMAASQKSDLFWRYFDRLGDEEKRETLLLLKDIESGRHPKLRRWRDSANHLLFEMAMRPHLRPYLSVVQSAFEEEFNDPERLKQWAAANDKLLVYSHGYDRSYEPAVLRFAVLASLGSTRLREAWHYLVDHAVSQRFRQLLWINHQLAGSNLADEISEIDYSDPDHPIVHRYPLNSESEDGR